MRIPIGEMNKIGPKCFTKNEDMKRTVCAGKVIFPNIEEPLEPIKSLLKNNHTLSSQRILE